MPFQPASVEREYEKNKELRREDVQALKEWLAKQPHLPEATELQLILFLQSCYFSTELAKNAIDAYFTLKTHCPDFFANKDPCKPSFEAALDTCVYIPLPKRTPQNYRVLYCKIIKEDPHDFNLCEQAKNFDMNIIYWLMTNGSEEGVLMVIDLEFLKFGHITKMGVMQLKKLMYYLQDGLPLRLKGIHIVNTASFMDTFINLIKSFMKAQLLSVLYIHPKIGDEFYKTVPKDILPKDFGGQEMSYLEYHGILKKQLKDGADFFKMEAKQVVDESKRPGKPKNAGELFGVEGSFKKLEID